MTLSKKLVTKWEYKIARVDYNFRHRNEEQLTTFLNQLGEEGWELVAIDRNYKGIFKRSAQ